jgi:hypothetical protein
VQTDINLTGLSGFGTTSMKALTSHLIEAATPVLVKDGDPISAVTCSTGGSGLVYVIPQTAKAGVTAGRWGYDIRASGPAGGPWTAVVRDSAGVALVDPSTSAPIYALARVYCAY